MSVFNYSQAVSSLKQQLEKIERQNSEWGQWFVSWVMTTEAEMTARRVQQLLTILPKTDKPVPCSFLPIIVQHLPSEDFRHMSFLQLKASRGVREIDDKNLTQSQRELSTVLSSLSHYDFTQVDRLLTQEFNEDGVFEAIVANMKSDHLLLLKDKAISILTTILSKKGYSGLGEDDIENILAELSRGETLNAAVKKQFPLDVELIINQQFYVRASKKALMAGSGWFRKFFNSPPEEMSRFEICETDIQCFRLLIGYLMGRGVEIEGGHEPMLKMHELAVKYQVQSLADFYDFKLAQCYDCFNKKEQTKILLKYPELKAFRKLKDEEWLAFLKSSYCHPRAMHHYLYAIEKLGLKKSLDYLQKKMEGDSVSKQERVGSLV